jgi:carbohydrate kinase (thermoresistant glucokinase family)
MGVSGSGKTTVARALAERLGWPFQEGDDLHPAANVAKMHAGIPLDDNDRLPWLRAVAAWVDARLAAGENGIITCSLLKRAYRAIVVGDRAKVRLLFLHGDEALISDHVAHRQNHFMPASLLHSQFETLEEPGPDERPIVVEIGNTVDETVHATMLALGLAWP